MICHVDHELELIIYYIIIFEINAGRIYDGTFFFLFILTLI